MLFFLIPLSRPRACLPSWPDYLQLSPSLSLSSTHAGVQARTFDVREAPRPWKPFIPGFLFFQSQMLFTCWYLVLYVSLCLSLHISLSDVAPSFSTYQCNLCLCLLCTMFVLITFYIFFFVYLYVSDVAPSFSKYKLTCGSVYCALCLP